MYESKRLAYLGKQNRTLDGILQRQIAAFLPSEALGRVLDFGAGNSPYRHYINCQAYVTADVSQNLDRSIDHVIAPNEKLPIDDNAFDAVLLLDVLEHVASPDFVLSEIRRVLTPEGRLYISVPFIYREHETPHDMARYTAFGMQELIRQQSGTVHRQLKVGNLHYTLLSLFLERGIGNGERNRLGLVGRGINRIVRAIVPLVFPLLAKQPRDEDGIYHHLLLEVGFS